MNTEQAYINGFVKRAGEYGLTSNQAIELLKQSGIADAPALATINKPTMFSGALDKVKNIFGNNQPSVPAQPPAGQPVRQFGMTNNQMQAAQNQIENGGELNLP